MKDKRYIKSFNEATENLNISVVSDSRKFTINDLVNFGKWLDDNVQQREYYPMSSMDMNELVELWLSSN
jgi:hypothetical protein